MPLQPPRDRQAPADRGTSHPNEREKAHGKPGDQPAFIRRHVAREIERGHAREPHREHVNAPRPAMPRQHPRAPRRPELRRPEQQRQHAGRDVRDHDHAPAPHRLEHRRIPREIRKRVGAEKPNPERRHLRPQQQPANGLDDMPDIRAGPRPARAPGRAAIHDQTSHARARADDREAGANKPAHRPLRERPQRTEDRDAKEQQPRRPGAGGLKLGLAGLHDETATARRARCHFSAAGGDHTTLGKMCAAEPIHAARIFEAILIIFIFIFIPIILFSFLPASLANEGLLFTSGEDALRGRRDARPTRGHLHLLRHAFPHRLRVSSMRENVELPSTTTRSSRTPALVLSISGRMKSAALTPALPLAPLVAMCSALGLLALPLWDHAAVWAVVVFMLCLVARLAARALRAPAAAGVDEARDPHRGDRDHSRELRHAGGRGVGLWRVAHSHWAEGRGDESRARCPGADAARLLPRAVRSLLRAGLRALALCRRVVCPRAGGAHLLLPAGGEKRAFAARWRKRCGSSRRRCR